MPNRKFEGLSRNVTEFPRNVLCLEISIHRTELREIFLYLSWYKSYGIPRGFVFWNLNTSYGILRNNYFLDVGKHRSKFRTQNMRNPFEAPFTVTGPEKKNGRDLFTVGKKQGPFTQCHGIFFECFHLEISIHAVRNSSGSAQNP